MADAESGEVLLANRDDEMVFTASTAKGFLVGSVFETLGPDATLTTPVYATTPVVDGAVAGDLVLVASGDLALGGRNADNGAFDHTFDADSVDHVYADLAPNADRIGDPLAGLDDLARQIAEQGVTRVDGDVLIDTSIWEPFDGAEGPTPAIFVNDNLVDVQVTADYDGRTGDDRDHAADGSLHGRIHGRDRRRGRQDRAVRSVRPTTIRAPSWSAARSPAADRSWPRTAFRRPPSGRGRCSSRPSGEPVSTSPPCPAGGTTSPRSPPPTATPSISAWPASSPRPWPRWGR